MHITVAGTGYVGLSIATLLAQHNKVTAVNIMSEKQLNLTATLDGESAYRNADFVVIAAPTNYDSQKNFFDTSAVESVIDFVLSVNPDAVMTPLWRLHR